MLIKVDGVKDRVESYFRDKNLIYGNVAHYPYKKSLGANYYVTKLIGSYKVDWDVIKPLTF
jgi:hypothetical protein